MAKHVLSGATRMAWDVLSGVTKTAWDVLFGVANRCGMFCPECQKMEWDVLSQDVLSYIRHVYSNFNRTLYLANCGDPDQTANHVASNLDQHCLSISQNKGGLTRPI